jgi:hypothetical protein
MMRDQGTPRCDACGATWASSPSADGLAACDLCAAWWIGVQRAGRDYALDYFDSAVQQAAEVLDGAAVCRRMSAALSTLEDAT